MFILFNLCW